MSHKLIFSSSFFAVMGTAMILSAQPVAPPPNPEARDREPHYRSKPQSQFPRTNRPNLNLLADESIPPISEEQEEEGVPTKPSEIRSTVSTPRATSPRTTVRVARDDVRGPKSDLVLATTIALANHEIVQLSEFANKRAQNVEVKKFAMLVSHDHSVFLKKLQPFAPEATQAGYLGSALTPGGTVAVTVPATTKSAATGEIEKTDFKVNVELPGPGSVPDRTTVRRVDTMTVPAMMRMERGMAIERLAADKELLSDKVGLELDENYVSQQIAMQRALRHKMAFYEHNSSPELAAVLAAGHAMTEEHSKRAEALLSTLAADSSPVAPIDNRIKREIKPSQD